MTTLNPADLNLNLTALTETVKPTSPKADSFFVRPLSDDEKSCAELQVKMPDWSNDDLATAFGKPLSWLNELQGRPDYQRLVKNVKRRLRRKAKKVVKTENLSEDEIVSLFNAEISNSLDFLVFVRDDEGAKHSDRLKAASMILDMAPKAPQRKADNRQVPNIVVNIPYQQVQTISEAAVEIGESDLIELLNESYENE
jgi:hypothetical protein